MDFSARFDALQQRVAKAEATVQAAATESRQQLRQRIDQAQTDIDQAAKDTKQQADQAAASAKSKWAQMKADASARMDDLRAKMDRRADQLDANLAASQASGRKLTPPTRSTSPRGRSTTRGWQCWTPSTPAPMPTSAPRRPVPGSACSCCPTGWAAWPRS